MFSDQIPDNQDTIICAGSVKTGHRYDFNTGFLRIKIGQHVIPYDVGIVGFRNHYGNSMPVIFVNVFPQEPAFGRIIISRIICGFQ